jgi:hypothetical protein
MNTYKGMQFFALQPESCRENVPAEKTGGFSSTGARFQADAVPDIA